MVAVLAVLLIVPQPRGPLPRSQALDLPQASTASSYRADTTESESVCSSTDFMPGRAGAVHGPNSIAATRADNRRAHDGKYWEGQSDLRISSSIPPLPGCPNGTAGTAWSGDALNASTLCVADHLLPAIQARPGPRPTQVWSPCFSAVSCSVRGLPVSGRGDLDLSREVRRSCWAPARTPPACRTSSVN